MYFTDRGIEELAQRRGPEEVSLEWLAGVDGTTTRMLSSAHSCRYRSTRPELWSGPWPSWPCGSSRVSALRWPHLTSPEDRNSSTTDWAPLAKSPNCASQATKASRFSTE